MRQARALMIFAAGFGTRMGALTATQPKPMVAVAGRPLIDHALDQAEAAGVDPIVVNLHYLGDQLAAHLADRPVLLSWEHEKVLETGGGLRKALPLLGHGPVSTLNSDAAWTGENAINQLEAAWDETAMDALLLVAPPERTVGHTAPPAFSMDDHGRLSRHSITGGVGYVYTGAQIIKTGMLAGISDEVFSMWRLWEPMIAAGRLHGVIHQGGWCDVGQPESIALAEQLLLEQGNV
jgi:N-acetyl-alpha-D-muramate 1-phosphate uridylyltransferase